jgi:predicted DNA binding CopG/RHH family protein
MKKNKFDQYEQEIIDSYEQGEWKSVKNIKQEKDKHRVYAKNTLKKDKRVNIRISSKDLEDIQVKALEEGIPYQTLMSSIIHKYVNGRLTDKKKITKHSSGR